MSYDMEIGERFQKSKEQRVLKQTGKYISDQKKWCRDRYCSFEIFETSTSKQRPVSLAPGRGGSRGIAVHTSVGCVCCSSALSWGRKCRPVTCLLRSCLHQKAMFSCSYLVQRSSPYEDTLWIVGRPALLSGRWSHRGRPPVVRNPAWHHT